jgi:uncharacterized membrane protein YfcA
MFSIDMLVLQLIPFFLIALLYSSVGHGGGSGYLAVMALLSFSPELIKPTALVLNIFVATIASIKFIKAGYFDKKAFASCAFTAIPMAFLGGYIQLNPTFYKLIAGAFLIVSAVLLVFNKKPNADICNSKKEISLPVFMVLGGLIGLFSGMIGIGGGIFLSPILVLSNRICIKKVSGVAALFILLNSLAGLAGHLSAVSYLDTSIVFSIIAVAIGGFLGSYLGSTKFSRKIIIYCLAVVLSNAGLKFIITAL